MSANSATAITPAARTATPAAPMRGAASPAAPPGAASDAAWPAPSARPPRHASAAPTRNIAPTTSRTGRSGSDATSEPARTASSMCAQ